MASAQGASMTTGKVTTGSRKLWKYTWYLVLVHMLMVTAGILTFTGPFHFWHDALSYLGSTSNTMGEPNTLSPYFFDAGLAACSVLAFRLAKIWQTFYILPDFRLYTVLLRMAALGYLMMILPCDLFNPVHMLGATLVFGAFWFYMVFLIKYAGEKEEMWKKTGFHILLHSSILPYAYTYMILRAPIKQCFQKIAVLGLMLSLLLIVRSLRVRCDTIRHEN